MKKNNLLKAIIIIILIIYISSYYVSNSGYYEYHMQQKTVLTNQKIKEFEKDIKDNQNIDIKDYLATEELDYSNKLSNFIYNLSEDGKNISRKVMKLIFKKLSYLVED